MATVTGMTAAKMLEIRASMIVNGEIDGANHIILTKYDGTQIDVGSILDVVPISSLTQQGLVELADDTETITGTDTARAVTPAGLAALTATDARKGLIETATDTETSDGLDTVRAVTPASLAALTANNTRRGLIETATQAEVQALSDVSRAVTPFGLAGLSASETQKGIVELATNAETSTGTDTTRAVTPAGLASVLTGKQASDSDLTAIAALAPANDDVIQRKSGAWTNRTMAQLATDLAGTNEFTEVRLHNGTSYADADNAHIYIGSVDPGAVNNGSVWFDTSA